MQAYAFRQLLVTNSPARQESHYEPLTLWKSIALVGVCPLLDELYRTSNVHSTRRKLRKNATGLPKKPLRVKL